MDVKFIVSGIQLENGVNSTAFTIGRSFFKAGGEVVIDPDYLSVIFGGKAGTAYYQIRVSDKKLWCPGDEVADALIVLQLGRASGQLPLAATNYLPKIKQGGLLLYDSSFVGEVQTEEFQAVPIPAYATAKAMFPQEEEKRVNLIRNSVMTGALFEIFGFDPESAIVRETFAEQFRGKGDTLEKNLAALEAGRAFVRERQGPYHKLLALQPPDRKRLFLTGSDAMYLSAKCCGADLYAGYPITPASPLLEAAERHVSDFGGAAIQAEDEIAAAMTVFGASYGGALAFTATSGPGFSLMAETIGHSGMTEVGMLIVDAQRAGPSTGMPTKTEQSDLMFAIFGHHGDIPKIVLAPGTPQEYFEVMPRAFAFMLKYQVPVIVLTSLDIAEGFSTIDALDLDYADAFDLSIRPHDKRGMGALHERFALTESGISPRAIPGERGKIFKINGSEHDACGFVTTNPSLCTAMMDKRLRKLDTFLAEDACAPEVTGPRRADVSLVGWGGTKGVIREAQERLAQEGLRVRTVHFGDLWPMSSASAVAAVSGARKTFVVENNATGQLAQLLRMKASEGGVAVPRNKLVSVLRYDGRPFEPCVIVQSVRKEVDCG